MKKLCNKCHGYNEFEYSFDKLCIKCQKREILKNRKPENEIPRVKRIRKLSDFDFEFYKKIANMAKNIRKKIAEKDLKLIVHGINMALDVYNDVAEDLASKKGL
jgi:hypothetical protein